MKAYLVVIVYQNASVVVESVFNDFDAAEKHCDKLRNDLMGLENCRINFIYVSQGYEIRS